MHHIPSLLSTALLLPIVSGAALAADYEVSHWGTSTLVVSAIVPFLIFKWRGWL